MKRASYTVDAQQRVLFTLTGDGASKLIDAPAELYESAAKGFATANTFIVEPSLAQDSPDDLAAIITDYVAQAVIQGRPAMACSRLGAFLDALAA